MRRFLRTVVFGLGASALSGCYVYLPVENPAPMTPVRITVPVSNALQNPNRAPETYTVDGTVVTSGDTLVLETSTRTETGAYREVVRMDTLRVATRSLQSVEEKVFSKEKTIGLSVLVTVGVAGLVTGILSVTTGSQGGGPGDGGSTTGQIRMDPIFNTLLRAIGR